MQISNLILLCIFLENNYFNKGVIKAKYNHQQKRRKRDIFSLEGRGKEDFKFRKEIIASSVTKKIS